MQGAGVYEFMVDGEKYVGRTINLVRRLNEHARKLKLEGKEMSDIIFHKMPGASISAQRKLEQTLINKYGPIGSPGLRNKINSIGGQ